MTKGITSGLSLTARLQRWLALLEAILLVLLKAEQQTTPKRSTARSLGAGRTPPLPPEGEEPPKDP